MCFDSTNMADKRNAGHHGYSTGGMMQTPYYASNMGMQQRGMVPQGMHPQMVGIPPPAYPMQPGYMPGMPMMNRMSMAAPAPPAYSPQMASNFRARQRTPEEIREQQEQFRKQRQYEEQRAKLRSFGNVGPAGRSGVNADKMIESMFGKTDRKTSIQQQQQHQQQVQHHPVYQQQQQQQFHQEQHFPPQQQHIPPHHNQTPIQQAQHSQVVQQPDIGDDGFGDFMAGPTSDVPTQPAVPPTIQSHPPPIADSSAVIAEGNNSSTAQGNIQPQQTQGNTASSQPSKPTEQRKDLMSMMMQCSDLTAPKEAKHFQKKRLVKDIHPSHPASSIHRPANHPSQQARDWKSTENFHGMFPLNQGSQPPSADPQGSTTSPPVTHEDIPVWCNNPDLIPPMYRQVAEAVIQDGKVLTERLYPILLLSGLSRESLGHIWSLANQKTPGQLEITELYMVLALIALAQNNYSVPSLSVLAQCQTPPIPFLGMNSQSAPTSQQATPQVPPTSSFQGVDNQSTVQVSSQAPPINPHQPCLATNGPENSQIPNGVQPTIPMETNSTEFTDFQQAPANQNQVDDFGDFKTAEAPSFSPKPVPSRNVLESPVHQIPQKLQKVEESLSLDDQHSNVSNFFCSDDSSRHNRSTIPPLRRKAPTTPNSLEDYFFDDAKSAASKDSSQFSTHSEMSEGEDFKNFEIYVEQFSSKEELSETSSPAKVPLETLPSRPISTPTVVPQISGPVKNGVKNIPRISVPQVTPSFNPTFPAQNVKTEDEDFSDFQEAAPPRVPSSSEVNLMLDDNAEDKYAALRGWTEDLKVAEPKSLLDADTSPAVSQTSVAVDPPASLPVETEVNNDEEDWADFKDCSEFTPTDASIATSQTTPIDFSSVSQTKGDNSDSYFPTVKTAHTNSTFPPMAVSDVSFGLFDQNPQTMPDDNKHVNSDLFNTGLHSSSGNNQMSEQDTSPTKELKDIDFDLSRVPPPMDFLEETEEEFKVNPFGPGSPTLDPNSPTFEASFDQQVSGNTKSVNPPWSGSPSGMFLQPALPRSASGKSALSFTDSERVSSQQISDAKSVSSLDLGSASIKQSDSSGSVGMTDNVDSNMTNGVNAESKSVDSFDIQEDNLEFTVNSSTPESKSLDSLDLKKVDSREWSPDDTDDPAPGVARRNSDKTETEVGAVPISAQVFLQNGSLPALGDRYAGVIEQVQGSDLHVQEWEKCLESANQIVYNCNNMFNSISSSSVSNEIIQCVPGSEYLTGVVEIYRVIRRISLAIESTGISSDKLNSSLKTINLGWNNLTAFIAASPIMPDSSSLDYRIAVLKSDDTASKLKACGVCLLNVDSRSKAFNEEKEGSKLTYGGRQYHTSCANFWVNCVGPMLPALSLPDLL